MADAFEALGQDVQKEAPHELCTTQAQRAFSALRIRAHREHHLSRGNRLDALIAHGRAVGVAREVVQHLGEVSSQMQDTAGVYA